MGMLGAGTFKITGITFKNVRLIRTDPEDLVAMKRMHPVIDYQRAFALYYPCQLHLIVPVQMWIKVLQCFILANERFIIRHRKRELKDLHGSSLSLLMVSKLIYVNYPHNAKK